ncbi:MAG: FtsQ-type POTRA domain-containing protein [Polyangiaceae bacterium]|jgi:cell division protein FtsQ|nr:FtsQ-type POTRA domain-containing protein [Polyangiaceae bacterium]
MAAQQPGRLTRAMGKVRGGMQGIRAAAGIVFVVAASIAMAWGLRQHVTTSPRFAVKTIRVDGTFRRTPEQVAETAGLQVGMNVFTVDLENARRRLLQDPWIADAQVERKLPSVVTLQVTENDAAAAVAVGADLYLCTHEGEIFKRLEAGDPGELVVVTGLMPEHLSSNRGRAIERVRLALRLLADYEQRGPSREYPAQEIHVAEDGSMRVAVGKAALTLEMGRAPYGKKVLRAARILSEVRRRSAEPSVLFLDNEAHPERVVVRMR